MKVKDLWCNNKTWNASMISNIFNNPKNVEDILKIYILCSDVNDKRVWPFTKDENLFTKSAYKILSQPTNNMIHWKRIWKSPLPQRILLFEWKCLHKGIIVRKWLGTKKCLCSTICPICEFEEETVEHALFL